MWRSARSFVLAFMFCGIGSAQAVPLQEGQFVDYRFEIQFDGAYVLSRLFFSGDLLDVGEAGLYTIGTTRGGIDQFYESFQNNGDGCNLFNPREGGGCPPPDPLWPYVDAPYDYYDVLSGGTYMNAGRYFLRAASVIGSFDVSVHLYTYSHSGPLTPLAPIPLPSTLILFFGAFGLSGMVLAAQCKRRHLPKQVDWFRAAPTGELNTE